ncbi:hypothetical protein GKC32_09450 [Lactobacillus curvatus]|nr:hypothetical protein [Latilactobacillus curvatus]MSD84787.1 hypothetical protein [Latilactobacillus curvatus]MSE24669.1 hypothetical protein [Latilactobacillus curvatus]
MSVKISTKVSSVQFAGGNVKLTLVTDAESVSRLTRADLSELQGKVVTADLMPESIEVITYLDEEGKPTITYTCDQGVWTEHRQEQVNLIDEEQLTPKSDMVAIADIDKFIISANYIEYNGDINPKEVVQGLVNGIEMAQLAEEQDVSQSYLEGELLKARKHFAPYTLASLAK